MLHPFRAQFPQGSILSEFLTIEHGLFVVRVQVQVDGVILGTGLAAERTIEEAEDTARIRAIETVLTASPGEYAVLDNQETIPRNTLTSSAIADQTSPPPTSPTLLAHPNNLETAPNIIAQAKASEVKASETSEAIAEALFSAVTNNESISEAEVTKPDVNISPPTQAQKAHQSLPPQPQTPEVTESLPIALDPNPKAYLETHIATHIETKNPEKTLPSDRPKTETILPLTDNKEDFVTPELVNHSSELEDLEITEIPPLSESGIAPRVPPKLTLSSSDPIDFSEVIAKSNMELKRLGWSSDQGRNYLLQTYGKRSRQLLSDEELLEFLLHLESQPTPVRA
jgi:hypothetical protein